MNRKALNWRMLDEEATEWLLADHRCQKNSMVYRRRFGILFPDQLIRLHDREFLVATVDWTDGGQAGMYWRSHPEGRTLTPATSRKNGAGYYR